MAMPAIPQWSLPLYDPPIILAASSAPVGVRTAERYKPVSYWQLGCFDGPTTVELTLGDGQWRLEIEPRTIFVIPPGSHRAYSTPRQMNHYYLAFGFRPDASHRGMMELPALIGTGPSAAAIRQDLVSIANLRESDRFESNLLAWLVLWRLVRIAREASKAQQNAAGAVQMTRLRIRENIADPLLTTESLAKSAGFSRRRLDQLFIQQVGKPVSACIRARRKELAVELLRQTSLRIQDVGMQVGISDPHSFNKFIRRACGLSPTALRTLAPPATTKP